jgi:hypothetical protein
MWYCYGLEQVHEVTLKKDARNDITRPVVFLRYNPNGKFMVNGVHRKIPRKHREKALLNLLKDISTGVRTFPDTLNVIYMFYPMTDGVPCILSEPEFSDQMKACVQPWCHKGDQHQFHTSACAFCGHKTDSKFWNRQRLLS